MQTIEAFLPLLKEANKKIFITTHFKPDGDAMGSSLGLYHYLLQKGHQPVVVSPSAVPDFLQWLPGIDKVLNYEADAKACKRHLAEADFIFGLDFNQIHRVKTLTEPLKKAHQTKILIDHHLEPEEEAFDYGISQPQKSSTCEMIYDYIQKDGGGGLINDNVMQCLYTGVMTDTGSFRFPATTASVHRMIADFLDRGLQHSPIHSKIFDVWSENRMRLLGHSLLNKMKLFPEAKTGVICLGRQDFEKFSSKSGDTEGIVNYPLSIRGITCAVLIIERSEIVKLSFRSQGNLDVSKIAREHFNGGGHLNAAGGQIKENLKTTYEKVKQILNLK